MLDQPVKEFISLPSPSAPTSRMFRVLVVDGSTWRTDTFRLRSPKGRAYHLRITPTEAKLSEALTLEWDIALFSCYLGNWEKPLLGADLLVKAFKEGKLKGVVCYGTIKKEGQLFLRYMKEEGVPALLIPYDWSNPSKRERVPFEGDEVA